MSDDWSYVRLKDYCTKIGSGSTPRGGANVYLDSGNVCLIRSQNIYNDGFSENGLVFISNSDAEKLNNVEIELNDVLINITGDSVARVCLAPKDKLPARVNQHVAIIRTVKNELDPKFVRYFLTDNNTQNHLLTLAGTGATRNALTKGMLEEFLVPKPDILIQKKISKILSDLDEKIHLNNQINQTLESIAQAIFKSWFIDFDPVRAKIAAKQEGNDPELAAMCAISGKSEEELQQMPEEDLTELRATAALFPDELVGSELGEVPKGWDKYSLSKMITLIGGGTPRRSEPNYWNGDISWFSVKDVPNEGEVFVITTQEKISELGLNKSSTKLLPVGTTIITARGTVGKIALVGHEMAMNQSCYGVQGKNGVKQFMTYYLIKNAVEVLKKNTHGAVFDTITQATFDTVTSIKPSIEMMDLFESKVEKIMGHIKNNLYENNSLIALRDTLLPKLLSGEIDVSGLQGEVA
ncbi:MULTISPECIES: restriction endonuclease subunit S [Acinetobacter]|uniref:restriction endonuclease subunit S n=1 Tax=Acinetobacter TaxID=469 RepID=UPI0005C895C5|nr:MULTISPECIES: restriction endonuclease subunit S [Acinetobacter]APX63745.1 type I restriction-modification system HsdS subunit protein [Acinetobacter schindleri]NWK61918.1 restriction endonuclease subunit S [Acinetobacter sp. SwsAc3]